MEELLKASATLLKESPQPFGIAHVTIDDEGKPLDIVYDYYNASMAAMTGSSLSDLLGKGVYDLWGGDTTWLDYFYQAAHEGRTIEFETANEMLEEFQHVCVFPIQEGYCAFTIEDVSDWISPAHLSMEQADSGLFFYDMRTKRVLLTPSAKEVCGIDITYTSLVDFVSEAFGAECVEKVRAQAQAFRNRAGGIYFEGRLSDGRWLRFSLHHANGGHQFSYGFLEDITRTKEAEEQSSYYFDIVDSLSRENFALYLVDLKEDRVEPYRLREGAAGRDDAVPFSEAEYSKTIDRYIATYVVEQDRERVFRDMSRDALLSRFAQGAKEVALNYQRKYNGDEQYVEARAIRLEGDGTKVVLAARNVTQEMNEQLRQRSALQSALELAEHASSAKSTFLTNMSHDFRTPMNSISGFANIALDHLEDTSRVRDCLHKIILSSDHLLNLVNDILDVSRIESGKLSLAEDPINVVELARDAENMFADKAAAQSLDFTLDVAVTHPHVLSDTLRLSQIVVNTLGNAIKFTPAGGMVAMSLRESDEARRGFGSYIITVRDTGCGMTPEFLSKVFDPFERDGLGYANKTEGTGLGMTITKSLVDLLGGTIEVESEVGRGSVFTIALPLRLAEEPEADAPEGRVVPVQERDFTGCRVLVVDDDDLSREILVEILKGYGFASDEARDGDAAVQKIASVAPFYYDAVLMDMRMPRMDGDEATRVIRALDRPDAASLPIIAETADAFEEGYRRARDAGMTALTTKPLKTQELIALLTEHIPEK
ncbi:hybrid sensor histidine kinase/response regulator [Adlercreutzia shanghongiae]|uniref:histidine kinase n=1 Tax=Adlercreutzia shanghongiae TaxID=3111773 RepID=A0ABU6IYG2_9ACTN|nr:ATP-binding protein [Adlercreutzia sp. R22]MEC4294891.1 ATP-binding protein [Adlercreutzia sp. R22]